MTGSAIEGTRKRRADLPRRSDVGARCLRIAGWSAGQTRRGRRWRRRSKGIRQVYQWRDRDHARAVESIAGIEDHCAHVGEGHRPPVVARCIDSRAAVPGRQRQDSSGRAREVVAVYLRGRPVIRRPVADPGTIARRSRSRTTCSSAARARTLGAGFNVGSSDAAFRKTLRAMWTSCFGYQT